MSIARPTELLLIGSLLLACSHAPSGSPPSIASGGSGGSGGGGGGGGGGSGGTASYSLVDRGLIVRYHIDEASEGTEPTELLDAAPDPLPLQITYTPHLAFTEQDGHRGLASAAAGTHGRASAPLLGTKVAALTGAKQATVETVVELLEVDWDWAYLSHIGEQLDGTRRLTLSAASPSRLRFEWRGYYLVGEWAAPLGTMGRSVLHVVLDTDLPNEDDRVKLYLNGALVTRLAGTPPAQFETIELIDESRHVLGNREAGQRSFRGTLFYSALYGAALTDEEVLQNTIALLVDDDAP